MKYKTIKFRDACKLVRGISYKSSDYTDENDENGEIFVNLKCVMPNGFRQDGIKYFNGSHKENQYVNNGDLLIANTDLTRNREVIGNSILVPEFNKKACFSMDLTKIEITDESVLDRIYLYYYLKSPKARWFMINHSDGSTVVHLSTRSIPEMDLEIPDLETQQKIVRILSALDQKIELNNQESENLRKIIKALYGNTATSIKEKTKLADLAKISSGKRPASIETSGEYVIVGARDVMGFTNKYNQEPEVIITGRVGTLGVVKRYPRKIWASDNTLIVDTRYKNYIECHLSSVDFGAYNRGSTQPLITQTDLKNFVLPFDKGKCDSFENKTAPLRNKMFAIEEQNEELIMLRDTLLPRLMEGTMDLNKVGL